MLYIIPSFVEISPQVPEKKIFECFFFIYGHGVHLSHVTQMPRTNFRTQFGKKKWPSGF